MRCNENEVPRESTYGWFNEKSIPEEFARVSQSGIGDSRGSDGKSCRAKNSLRRAHRRKRGTDTITDRSYNFFRRALIQGRRHCRKPSTAVRMNNARAFVRPSGNVTPLR